MTSLAQKSQEYKKVRGGSIMAAVAGIVAVAGVTAAGILAFKDKKNRTKVTKVLSDIKNRTVKYIGLLKDQTAGKTTRPSKKR